MLNGPSLKISGRINNLEERKKVIKEWGLCPDFRCVIAAGIFEM